MTATSAMQARFVGERDGYTWYHVDDPAGPALDELAKEYGLHELAVEDCRVPETRAKIDQYGDTLFVVANIVHYDAEPNECSFTEMDFFVNEKFVISVTPGQNAFADAVQGVICHAIHASEIPRGCCTGCSTGWWTAICRFWIRSRTASKSWKKRRSRKLRPNCSAKFLN